MKSLVLALLISPVFAQGVALIQGNIYFPGVYLCQQNGDMIFWDGPDEAPTLQYVHAAESKLEDVTILKKEDLDGPMPYKYTFKVGDGPVSEMDAGGPVMYNELHCSMGDGTHLGFIKVRGVPNAGMDSWDFAGYLLPENAGIYLNHDSSKVILAVSEYGEQLNLYIGERGGTFQQLEFDRNVNHPMGHIFKDASGKEYRYSLHAGPEGNLITIGKGKEAEYFSQKKLVLDPALPVDSYLK